MKKLLPIVLLAFVTALHASAQNYPLVSIHDLQYVSPQNLANGNDTSAYFGDTVQVEGYVTFNPCAYGLSTTGSRVGTWLEDSSGGAWSGIAILIDPGALGLTGISVAQLNSAVLFQDNFVVGNKVKCTVLVSDFNHNSQLLCLPVASQVIGSVFQLPPPIVLPIDSFEKNISGVQTEQLTSGEPYEGTLVQFNNVQIVDVSLGTGSSTGRIFWTVEDAQGNKIKIRDMSGWIRNDTFDNFCTSVGSFTPWTFPTPQVNTNIAFVRGIIMENKPSNGPFEYNIAPRDTNDIGPQTFAAPVITNIHTLIPVPTTTQNQQISATITDADGTVSSATLYYTVGLNGTTFTPVAMTQVGTSNVWNVTVPATGPDSTYIKYYIKAVDNDGHHSFAPDSLGTNSFYLILNSGVNSISDIQYNPLHLNDSPINGGYLSNVNIQGIVMSTTGLTDLGLVVIQSSSAPWSGITLKGPGLSGLHRGDKINITAGHVIEDNAVTKLDSITFTTVSTNNALPAPAMNLNIDSVRLGAFNYSEAYESMLLEFDNVFVNNTDPDVPPSNFGEWSIALTANAPAGLRADDYSNDIAPKGLNGTPPTGFNVDSLHVGEALSYIRGILMHSFGNWKILPRNKNDIAGFHTVSGIASLSNYHAVDAYPNPTSNELRLHFVNANEQVNYELTDMTGRMLNRSVLKLNGTADYNVPVENLSPGVYIIRVSTSDGSQTLRFVKQ